MTSRVEEAWSQLIEEVTHAERVFDSYSRESQDLLHSMKESGFHHPTVVLEPNGFLPDGVESPFLYFLGQPEGEKRGRYFNEVPSSRFLGSFWG